MKIFTTIALTCCLIAVIVLQAMTLKIQKPGESVIRFQPANDPMPVIETAAYSVELAETEPAADLPDAPEDIAATEIGVLETGFQAPVVESTDSAPGESAPGLLLSDSGATEAGAFPQLPAESPSPQTAANNLSAPSNEEQKTEQQKPPPELAKYPIWLLIQPDGVRFLQTEEEIATHFHTIPPNAFLLGCQSATFEAGPAEESLLGESGQTSPARAFQLQCENFVLKGSFGTKQQLEVTGSSLDYSTESKQILLQGTEESSLDYLSVDQSASTRMQADEIVLQLHNDRFQVSAKGATGVEIEPNPDTQKQQKYKRSSNGSDPFPGF